MAAPAPWPDNPIARAIRRHPRIAAALVALCVLAVGLPLLRSGAGELAWRRAHPSPVPADLGALADGSAPGGGDLGFFRVVATPFPELTEAASRGTGGAGPAQLPYVPLGRTKGKGKGRKREVLAVARIAGDPADPAWGGGAPREIDVVAHPGARLPADVAALFAGADSGTPWATLPLLDEADPDDRAATRAAVVGGIAVGLALLALLGAAAGGRQGGGASPPLPRPPEEER